MTLLKHKPMLRRTLLRGVAGGSMITVALPWLEAMEPRKAHAQTRPKRFIGFLKPNGMSAYRADAFSNPQADNWTPRTAGALSVASLPTAGNLWGPAPSDAALKNFIGHDLLKDITVISGVHNQIIGANGLAHDAQTTLFTPYRYVSAGSQMYQNKGGGRSLDQVIADKIGTTTRFRSLEFACATTSNTVAPMAVFVSFTAAGQENRPENMPDRMWTKIFAQGVTGGPTDPAALERLRNQRKSILDVVKGNISSLNKKLGAGDQRRLAQHLASIQAIEQSVTNLTTGVSSCQAPVKPPTLAETGPNIPKLMTAQIDLLVMALACDLTRSATFSLGGGQSDAVYPFLGLGTTMFVDSHHALTHGGSKTATDKIDQWQMANIADLIYKLKTTQEGPQTLLDNTVVLVGSDSAGGWHHNAGGTKWGSEDFGKGMPLDWAFILAGGTDVFRHGTHVRFRSGTQTHVPLLESVYQAVTGEASPSTWGTATYKNGSTMPGLKGDRSANMF